MSISGKWLGNDFEHRWVFSRWWNVDNDSADTTSEGRPFHVHAATTFPVVAACTATTGKAQLAADDSLMGGTTRRLVSAEWRDHWPGWSAMRLSGPRYCDTNPCKILYASTEILNWTRSGTHSQCRQTNASQNYYHTGMKPTRFLLFTAIHMSSISYRILQH